MIKLKFAVPILLLAVLVLVGAGCGGDGVTPEAPTSDVAGQDISDIPRYPGSVRIHYGPVSMDPDVIVIVYLTSESVDTVADFYETQLPANGWESLLDAETMEEFGLTYRYVGQGLLKEGRQTIVLVRASEDYSGYTDINITVGPE
ncbi:MAG: hypothetical protein E3J36_02475 [Candidatus Nealsonbacteria bacterium]|nr:MAG: hypothetical protein E3J36_02475 [Candidatus Nealsonbacteria bacterium]